MLSQTIPNKCDKMMKVEYRTKFRHFLHSVYNTMKKLLLKSSEIWSQAYIMEELKNENNDIEIYTSSKNKHEQK